MGGTVSSRVIQEAKLMRTFEFAYDSFVYLLLYHSICSSLALLDDINVTEIRRGNFPNRIHFPYLKNSEEVELDSLLYLEFDEILEMCMKPHVIPISLRYSTLVRVVL